MVISDLNYLEVVSEEVVGGVFYTPTFISNEDTTINVTENIDITKLVNSNVTTVGNFGSAQASVEGFANSLTQAFSFISSAVATGRVLNSSSAISAAR